MSPVMKGISVDKSDIRMPTTAPIAPTLLTTTCTEIEATTTDISSLVLHNRAVSTDSCLLGISITVDSTNLPATPVTLDNPTTTTSPHIPSTSKTDAIEASCPVLELAAHDRPIASSGASITTGQIASAQSIASAPDPHQKGVEECETDVETTQSTPTLAVENGELDTAQSALPPQSGNCAIPVAVGQPNPPIAEEESDDKQKARNRKWSEKIWADAAKRASEKAQKKSEALVMSLQKSMNKVTL